ncbi:MAG: transporter substrate-binding domain-containing protein [Muribaculaceae bacterium]|nr:transporter substrate-binding domain-containing protein [Muribaculaceae bacterium]
MKKLKSLGTRFLVFYLISGTIVLALMVALMRNCSGATWHVNDMRASGDTINVAIEISPMGLSLKEDSLSGFYYDMIREMAAAHDRELKIDGFTNLKIALDKLDNGRYDLVISDMAANAKIRQRFLATKPVLIDRQVLVQLLDTAGELRYTDQLSLVRDTIYVPSDTPFKTRLQHLTREIGDTIYIVEEPQLSAEQLIILVALGERPNAVVNRRLADLLSRDYPQLDSSVEISFSQFQSWLLNGRDSLLRDSINLWIDQYVGSDAMKELEKRYF